MLMSFPVHDVIFASKLVKLLMTSIISKSLLPMEETAANYLVVDT